MNEGIHDPITDLSVTVADGRLIVRVGERQETFVGIAPAEFAAAYRATITAIDLALDGFTALEQAALPLAARTVRLTPEALAQWRRVEDERLQAT